MLITHKIGIKYLLKFGTEKSAENKRSFISLRHGTLQFAWFFSIMFSFDIREDDEPTY